MKVYPMDEHSRCEKYLRRALEEAGFLERTKFSPRTEGFDAKGRVGDNLRISGCNFGLSALAKHFPSGVFIGLEVALDLA